MRRGSFGSLCSVVVAGLLMSGEVMAGTPGGTITYGPAAASIPTLSEIGMLITGLLVAVIGFRVMRANPGRTPLASVLLMSGLAIGAAGVGTRLVDSAYAAILLEMSVAAGGTMDIPPTDGTNIPVENTSGVTQHILGRSALACTFAAPSLSPECTIGSTVAPDGTCYVRFSNCLD